MGYKNYLIEGVSCTGKTSVCKELKRRGYIAIDGDTKLAYQGDPRTGAPTKGHIHEHHIWDVEKVDKLLSNGEKAVFFCGGSRNFEQFLSRFDEVLILDIDHATLEERLDARENGQWGSTEEQKRLVLRLHKTKEDVPKEGTIINACEPISDVVDAILRHTGIAS